MKEYINENEFILICDGCGMLATGFQNSQQMQYYLNLAGWKEIINSTETTYKCKACVEKEYKMIDKQV